MTSTGKTIEAAAVSLSASTRLPAALLALAMWPLAFNTVTAQQPRAMPYEALKTCLTSPPNDFVEGKDFILAAPTRVDYYTKAALEAGALCAANYEAKSTTTQQAQGITYSILKACLTAAPNGFVEGKDFKLANPTQVDYYSQAALEAGRRCTADEQAKKVQTPSPQKN